MIKKLEQARYYFARSYDTSEHLKFSALRESVSLILDYLEEADSQ